MVQVGPETAGLDQQRQIPRRRRNQLDVDRTRRHRPKATHALLLDGLQHFALHRLRQRIDFVEKERAARCRLEEARLGALGVRERPGLEAKQLGFEHRLWNGRTVHVDERAVGARAAVVDDARDEAFAGAGLSIEKNGRHVWVAECVEGGEVADLRAQASDLVRDTEDRVSWVPSRGHGLRFIDHFWPSDH